MNEWMFIFWNVQSTYVNSMFSTDQLWTIKNVISFEETVEEYLTWRTSFNNMLVVVSLVVLKHNTDIRYSIQLHQDA